jgi:hypothetical protein
MNKSFSIRLKISFQPYKKATGKLYYKRKKGRPRMLGKGSRPKEKNP